MLFLALFDVKRYYFLITFNQNKELKVTYYYVSFILN